MHIIAKQKVTATTTRTRLYRVVLAHGEDHMVGEVEVLATLPAAPEVRVPAIARFLGLNKILLGRNGVGGRGFVVIFVLKPRLRIYSN